MTRRARWAAAVLPLLGLGVLWAQSHHTFHQGTEWDVPIEGYDPRDYLRGHFVEFTYDWPGLEADDLARQPGTLCLEGKPPRLAAVVTAGGPGDCTHQLTVDAGGVYGANALMTGRLYIGQSRAAALQEQLRNRDRRGIVTIRQRGDGSFTPVAIRFRPLTPEERAARDRPDAGEGILPAAPAIMTRP